MSQSIKKMSVPIVDGNDTKPRSINPFSSSNPFQHMRRRFDTLFQELDHFPLLFASGRSLLDDTPSWFEQLTSRSAMVADVKEHEKSYEITAEVPGMSEKDLSVKVVNGYLEIKGEKKQQHEDKSAHYHVTERHFGTFQRLFALPKGVDADSILAKFNHGVLTVTMPKKADAIMPEKTIPIQHS